MNDDFFCACLAGCARKEKTRTTWLGWFGLAGRRSDRDAATADGRGDLDVFGPIYCKDVGAVVFLTIDADSVNSAPAGAEGFHEGSVELGGVFLTVEQVDVGTYDVLVVLCLAPLVLIDREDTDTDVDFRVEQKRSELRAVDANLLCTGELGDDGRVVSKDCPCGQSDDHAVWHTADVGCESLDE